MVLVDCICLSTDCSSHALPMRPASDDHGLRWRDGIPIIRRDEDSAFIGGDARPLTLTTAEGQWLTSIGQCNSWTQARHTCPTGEARAEAIVQRARAAGAVTRAGECWWLTPGERAAMQPLLLSLSQWHPAPESAIAARSAWDIAVIGDGDVADAVRTVIHASGLNGAVHVGSSTIVILVGVRGIEAPEALLPAESEDEASVRDRPHLPVSTYRARASVGPLVLPGRTPCLRCMHLHRLDADPGWSRIVEQWRDVERPSTPSADPVLAWQAAVTATIMVRTWIDGPDGTEPERIHWSLPSGYSTTDSPAWHPRCGCRWPLLSQGPDPQRA